MKHLEIGKIKEKGNLKYKKVNLLKKKHNFELHSSCIL